MRVLPCGEPPGTPGENMPPPFFSWSERHNGEATTHTRKLIAASATVLALAGGVAGTAHAATPTTATVTTPGHGTSAPAGDDGGAPGSGTFVPVGDDAGVPGSGGFAPAGDDNGKPGNGGVAPAGDDNGAPGGGASYWLGTTRAGLAPAPSRWAVDCAEYGPVLRSEGRACAVFLASRSRTTSRIRCGSDCWSTSASRADRGRFGVARGVSRRGCGRCRATCRALTTTPPSAPP